MIIVNGFKPLTIITECSMLDVAAVLDPPRSIFQDFKDAATLVSIWHSYEPHAKNLPLKENLPRTFLVHSIAESAFIQPLEKVTITQHHLAILIHVLRL